MIDMKRSALTLALVTCTLFAQTGFAQADCPDAKADLAMQAGDLTSVTAVYKDVEFNASCSNALRKSMRASLGALHLAQAETQSGDAKIMHLEEALKFGGTWEYQVALGEALVANNDFGAGAMHLQNAINRVNDNPNEGTIDRETALRLVRLASQAMALSETPVDVPPTRNGNTGGIFSKSVRGFEVVEVDVHVTFEFDSTEFTPEGSELARQMADAMIQQAPEEITLEGHTDPQGSEDYNFGLSQQRAEAMRVFLLEAGFQGKINVVARGEEEPPVLEANLTVNEEQTFKLARRVELIR